jgi:uncharacterized membrane protein YcaP (DUF421 family)
LDTIFNIDWQSMFVAKESLLEIVIRGTIMYLAMYFLLRIFRRQSGTIGIADLLVIVVIADAAQNGMAGDSKSITEALILISTIIFWDFFFDWLGFRSVIISKILERRPLLLIENGKFLRKNMEKELITEAELTSQLRQQGQEDASRVKKCYLESNGRFSVLTESEALPKQKSN